MAQNRSHWRSPLHKLAPGTDQTSQTDLPESPRRSPRPVSSDFSPPASPRQLYLKVVCACNLWLHISLYIQTETGFFVSILSIRRHNFCSRLLLFWKQHVFPHKSPPNCAEIVLLIRKTSNFIRRIFRSRFVTVSSS